MRDPGDASPQGEGLAAEAKPRQPVSASGSRSLLIVPIQGGEPDSTGSRYREGEDLLWRIVNEKHDGYKENL
jgi:hypothetical protein